MLKAGVIGLGRIGVEFPDSHAQAYKDCTRTELVYLWDIDEDRIDKWCRHYSVVNREDIDILSICTPPETHCSEVERALRVFKGLRAIYLEKPIALTLGEADKIITLCEDKKVILQVNHQRRFGQPTFYFNRGVLNNGTHAVDMLRQLLGDCVVDGKTLRFYNGANVDLVETEHSDKTDFRFVVESSILKGVEHLVYCVEHSLDSISDGYTAREDLRVCLEWQRSQKSSEY
jgi:predicted dehydrogenase